MAELEVSPLAVHGSMHEYWLHAYVCYIIDRGYIGARPPGAIILNCMVSGHTLMALLSYEF